MNTIRTATLMMLLGATAVSAHVSVSPREAAAGASQRYVVRVPTEGQVATVSLELDVPAGVTVTDVPSGDGFKIDTRREGGRVTAITWTREIKPRDSAEFTFVATNPPGPGEVAWKAHQRFADGTTAEWTGVAGDRRPAAVTRITAGDGGRPGVR